MRNIPMVDEYDGPGEVHPHGRAGRPARGDREVLLAPRLRAGLLARSCQAVRRAPVRTSRVAAFKTIWVMPIRPQPPAME